MKTKLLLGALLLALCFTYAQTDTLYVIKSGHVLDKYHINNQLDSTIYYNPTDLSKAVTDSIYFMNSSEVVKQYNIYNELDSVVFYNPITTGKWPTIQEASLTEFSPTVLTVLVDFSDTNMEEKLPNSEAEWAQLIYGQNQAQGNHYYYETSGGQVQLKPAQETNGIINNGVVKVKLSTPVPASKVSPEGQTWYGEALDALTSTVDFSSFDQNNDNILTDMELSVLFVFNMTYYQSISGSEAVANVRLNHAISGTGITLENYTRVTINNSSIGVPMHELGHHFLEMNHFASPSDHGLMGLGAYAQDPEIGLLTNPSWRGGTRPTGLIGHTALFCGLVSSTEITETTLGVELHGPETGLNRNLIELPVKDGILYIENRSSWGYDQSIPFCDGAEGGVFFTEVSQYVKPLNIPAIQRNLTSDNYVESDIPFCEYYAHAGHNDSFEYGGWRFENISVAGPTMTMDIIKLNVEPEIDHYTISYWEIDPDKEGYRRRTYKKIGGGVSPDMNFSEMYGGDSAGTTHPVWINVYYSTGETRNLNATVFLDPTSLYVNIIGSPFTNEGAVLQTGLLNVGFNTSNIYAQSATIYVSNDTTPIGNFTLSNIPAP